MEAGSTDRQKSRAVQELSRPNALFLSTAAAYFLAECFGNSAYGFLAVGAFYRAVALAVYGLRGRIERPILRKFSEIFFAD